MKINKKISHLIISEKTKISEAIKISNNNVGALIVAKNKFFFRLHSRRRCKKGSSN